MVASHHPEAAAHSWTKWYCIVWAHCSSSTSSSPSASSNTYYYPSPKWYNPKTATSPTLIPDTSSQTTENEHPSPALSTPPPTSPSPTPPPKYPPNSPPKSPTYPSLPSGTHPTSSPMGEYELT
mmetsp:Transcript_15744/g.17384  ORF Transcript_15744/g.17384 Transcript_15744/m.17384 type:complete len:124 (-) Transcript_15744:764-1135(-)